jgi:2-keto-4-pentenoate hydratase/2-oxohepta-3-ene-1,7-dioic acid hydratase in catechol pathway
MKLIRYGLPAQEKPGLFSDDGFIRDLSSIVRDIDGSILDPHSLARLRELDPMSLPIVEGPLRLGPCVGQVGKFICIGLNYADHAAESNMPVPAEPVVFMKATSAIMGPNDDVVLPRGSQKTDWEVELGVIIGKHAKYVSESNALGHVAGYCVINDLSERAFQLEGTGQWVKGKSADTFGPIGPWLVTADEIPNPQTLTLWLEVDGRRYQDGNTRTMVFGVANRRCC